MEQVHFPYLLDNNFTVYYVVFNISKGAHISENSTFQNNETVTSQDNLGTITRSISIHNVIPRKLNSNSIFDSPPHL